MEEDEHPLVHMIKTASSHLQQQLTNMNNNNNNNNNNPERQYSISHSISNHTPNRSGSPDVQWDHTTDRHPFGTPIYRKNERNRLKFIPLEVSFSDDEKETRHLHNNNPHPVAKSYSTEVSSSDHTYTNPNSEDDDEEDNEREPRLFVPLSRSPSLLRHKTDVYLSQQQPQEGDFHPYTAYDREDDNHNDSNNNNHNDRDEVCSLLREMERIHDGKETPFQSYLFVPLPERKTISNNNNNNNNNTIRVSCVKFSPLFDILLVGDVNGVIYYVPQNSNNNNSVSTLHGHVNRVTCFSFTSSSSMTTGNNNNTNNNNASGMFASSSKDNSVLLWSASNKTQLRRISVFSVVNPNHETNSNENNNHNAMASPSLISFMPFNDNYLLVSFEDTNKLTLYNCSTGLEIKQDHSNNNNNTNTIQRKQTTASKISPFHVGGQEKNSNSNNNKNKKHVDTSITSLLVEEAYYPFFFTGHRSGDVCLWTSRAELRYLQPEGFSTFIPHNNNSNSNKKEKERKKRNESVFFHLPDMTHPSDTNEENNKDDESNHNNNNILHYHIPRLRMIHKLSITTITNYILASPSNHKNNVIRDNFPIIRMQSQMLNKRQMKNVLTSSSLLPTVEYDNNKTKNHNIPPSILSQVVKREKEKHKQLNTNSSFNYHNAALQVLSPLVLLISFANGVVVLVGVVIDPPSQRHREEEKKKTVTTTQNSNDNNNNANVITNFFSSLFSDPSTENNNHNRTANASTNNQSSAEQKQKIIKSFLHSIHLVPLFYTDMHAQLRSPASGPATAFTVGAALCRDNKYYVVFAYYLPDGERTRIEIHAVCNNSTNPKNVSSFMGVVSLPGSTHTILELLWGAKDYSDLVVVPTKGGEVRHYQRQYIIPREEHVGKVESEAVITKEDDNTVKREDETGKEDDPHPTEEERGGRLSEVSQTRFEVIYKDRDEWEEVLRRERQRQQANAFPQGSEEDGYGSGYRNVEDDGSETRTVTSSGED
ncbi:hypothetical protein ADEAN_000593300 [Angomonas deanei]|uniref:WD domain, G-beta repeat n=1 Tax=Angomonas deanei TaxID=59799 RepID=A0A7G2CGG0_9TRYP|nr:hypothetical protein ADEAN_000593300 [Angomonas deanei]